MLTQQYCLDQSGGGIRSVVSRGEPYNQYSWQSSHPQLSQSPSQIRKVDFKQPDSELSRPPMVPPKLVPCMDHLWQILLPSWFPWTNYGCHGWSPRTIYGAIGCPPQLQMVPHKLCMHALNT